MKNGLLIFSLNAINEQYRLFQTTVPTFHVYKILLYFYIKVVKVCYFGMFQ